jgi:hypothetical protein
MNPVRHRPVRILATVAAAFLIVLPGCDHETDPASTPEPAMPVTGRWIGDLDEFCDTEHSRPSLLFELSQRDSVITGYVMQNCGPLSPLVLVRGAVVRDLVLIEAVSSDLLYSISFSAPIDSVAMHGTYLLYYLDHPENSRSSTWSAHEDPHGEIHWP